MTGRRLSQRPDEEHMCLIEDRCRGERCFGRRLPSDGQRTPTSSSGPGRPCSRRRGGSSKTEVRALFAVHAVADAIGTSTRAVYSIFGSKDGLLDPLAQRSFELLRDSVARLPATDDPSGDLVDAAVEVFRPMAIEHPSMFSLAFLRAAPDLEFDEQVQRVSAEGLMLLRDRIQRLADADLLGGRDVRSVLAQFNAMCQGMASVELRNPGLVGPQPQARVARSLRDTAERASHPRRTDRLTTSRTRPTVTTPRRARNSSRDPLLGFRLSAREVARLLGTSPTQPYRLLDPTNYTKSLRRTPKAPDYGSDASPHDPPRLMWARPGHTTPHLSFGPVLSVFPRLWACRSLGLKPCLRKRRPSGWARSGHGRRPRG